MNTKFINHIDADPNSLERLDPTAVRIIKDQIDAGPGVRYTVNGNAVFRSNSQEDILDIIKFGKWSNTTTAKQVEKGSTIYVIPNEKEMKLYGDFSFGVKFKAAGPAYREAIVKEIWSSEIDKFGNA
jgi:DNA-binding beta-propeller fold protein YncE